MKKQSICKVLSLCIGLGAGWAYAETALEGELLRQERLGHYYHGRGDVMNAMVNLAGPADAGHARSQYLMGAMEEAATNYVEAERWYRKAVAQGVNEANHALAGMYANGLLGDKDLAAAYSLELDAAERGHEQSILYVAGALEYGRGVEQDWASSLRWLERAASQGSVLALKQLLRAHERGELGLSSDEVAIEELKQRIEQASKAEAAAKREFRLEFFRQQREIEERYLSGEG